jgi:hypothetical protein
MARGAVVALVAALAAPGVAAGFECERVDAGGCPPAGTTCYVACAEDDLRAALAALARCASRDVTVALGPDAATPCGPTPIPLRMDPTAPATAPGSCGDDHRHRHNALCLTGTGIVLDGRGAVLQYTGDHVCASCSGECSLCPGGACASRQPALLVVRGGGNTVRDLDMRFFPEGIHLREGDGHVVEGVTSRFVCEEAITVDGGTGHRITGATLVGHADAAAGGGACHRRIERSACAIDADCAGLAAGARCYCGTLSRLGDCAAPPGPPLWPLQTPGQCYVPSRCGLDKAIQVNGGAATIERNRIDAFGQPVSVLAGTHVIAGNVSCGDRRDRNVCQAYGVRGGRVTFRDNRIDHCKFGIRLDGTAEVDAVGNVITNGWVSGFQVKGQGDGRLRAEGNRLRGNGHSTESDCERGGVVVTNPLARLDLGGGDFEGAAVLADLPPSRGENAFCEAGAGAPHLWSATCGCAGDCPDDGASIGLDGNGFAPRLVLPPAAAANVVDGPPLETRAAAAAAYRACETIVVAECECPDGACPPEPAGLVLVRAVVRARGDGTATLILRGGAAGAPPGAGPVALEMPGVLGAPLAWAAEECSASASGRLRCRAASGARVRFTPRATGYAFRVAAAAPALAARAADGVAVVLEWDGTRRSGALAPSACRERGATLRCGGR